MRKRMVSLLLAAALLAGCTPREQPQTQPTEDTASAFVPIAPTEETSAPTEPTQPPAVTVSTFEELAALAAGDTLLPGDTVCISGTVEMTEAVTFSIPVSLEVEGEVDWANPIIIETYDRGTLRISTPAGADIRLDCPNCDVVWQEGLPYETGEEAAELLNVRRLNGIDLRDRYGLGGTGARRIAAATLEPEDNSGLESALSFSLEGNVLYLAVSFRTDDKTLENAVVSVTTTDGETEKIAMDLTVGERYYHVPDPDTGERVYKVVTQRITYNLPVLYIEIDNGKEVTSRENYLQATISIDSSGTSGTFPSLDTTEVLIRGRGHYSWSFPKKSYKLRFESKTPVLGMAASKNWTLLANYADRSLIQNYLALEMGKVMTNICYHTSQYPVDVFVNGSYRGVYTLGEQIEAKEERLDLEESYSDPDTDYLLEVGGYDDGDVLNRDYFQAGTLRFVAVKHPDSTMLSREQLDYLISYVTAADEAVRTLTNYEDYIDVDSLIDWVILHELSYNLDCCFRRSCYLIKEAGGKLKMGPIWDFDLAFGSFYRYQSGDWATVGEEGGYVGVTWMNYLKKDPAFMERFTARWNEIKEELLEKALTSIDEMSALVAPSAEINFEVWDILGKAAPAQPSSHKKYDTYELMVERLRSFVINRYNWLDGQLN